MSNNDSAVAEAAITHLLKDCTSRNQATYVLFLGLLVAGWDGGRRRRPQPETDLLWGVGYLTRTIPWVGVFWTCVGNRASYEKASYWLNSSNIVLT
jgi:hypothetical protein